MGARAHLADSFLSFGILLLEFCFWNFVFGITPGPLSYKCKLKFLGGGVKMK